MAIPTKQEIEALVASLNAAAAAYSDAPDLTSYIGRVEIIAKAKKLVRALQMPEQLPNYHGLNMAELIAIRTFMKLRVLEAIPETGSISLAELAGKTGVQPSLLERMSRILVATGFLSQTTPHDGSYMYQHTKFSLAYLLSDSDTRPSPGHLFLAMYDHWFKPMHAFDDYLSSQKQLAYPAVEPTDPLINPYTTYFSQQGTPVWSIMAQDPEKLAVFQKGMAGIDVAIPPVGHFPFATLANTPFNSESKDEEEEGVMQLVDVGGGQGLALNKILQAHPELDPKLVVLQDRPDVVALAREARVLPEGVRVMEHDFMGVQPLKGAKAYFMRMILHDYADAVGIQILSRLADAMSPTSRVLVCEMVVASRVTEVDFASAVMDQAVMSMGGKERTEEGFRSMFEAAGLELVKVWRVQGVPGACVEGRLKQ